MKRFVHDKSAVDMLHEFESKLTDLKHSEDEDIESATVLDSEESRFERIAKKQVEDIDGFLTDYCLYYDKADDIYVTVFGDSDLYRPEDGYFDEEFETREEAIEWFDNYGEE